MTMKQAAIQEQIQFKEGLISGLMRQLYAFIPASTHFSFQDLSLNDSGLMSLAFNQSVMSPRMQPLKQELKRLENLLDVLKNCHSALDAEAA